MLTEKKDRRTTWHERPIERRLKTRRTSTFCKYISKHINVAHDSNRILPGVKVSNATPSHWKQGARYSGAVLSQYMGSPVHASASEDICNDTNRIG